MKDSSVIQRRPAVVVSKDECKGCSRCVEACPNQVLILSKGVNANGLRYAEAPGLEQCTGCGICFYNCPEPGAITVYKKVR